MSGKPYPSPHLEADYVIVGSGSAGSVLASRLSENPKNRVIVIEYGGSDWGPLIQMPAALSIPMNMDRYNWGFESEPEPHLGGRRIPAPRGKVIGGSSSINGMVYVRGHARDFDNWAQSGASGWSYSDVLPYFQRMENLSGNQTQIDSIWRGQSGPLHITRPNQDNELYRAFIKAGIEAGFQFSEDYNGEQQEGFGVMEQTIRQGRRWSTANAYLKPALKRSNVRLVRGMANRIKFKNNKAIGIEYDRGNGTEFIAARSEVIVSASAFNSPKLLMLSGIGDGQELTQHGIKTIADRKNVGKNLQDHLEIWVQYECRKPITLHSKLNIFSKAGIGLQWLLSKSGIGASNQFESAAFLRSRAGVEYPDIQFHFLPAAISYDGKPATNAHGFQAHVGPMRSKSRGAVKLNSGDPHEPPSITFNYMAHDEDWRDFRHCVRLTREIFSQPAFDVLRGREISPGSHVEDDEAMDAFIREAVESAYHPCGTCKMGDAQNEKSVVDPECRVIGVEGLRVVDSSIFPNITNGNLNAPTIMVAEKAADHILGKRPLARSELLPWINPDWRTSDR